MKRDRNNNDIAIIGMSGIFPKARNLDEYWTNLEQGIDCVSEIPLSRWDKEEYYSKEKSQNNKTYSCWGGVVENAYEFDPVFFNIAPKEAPYIDPQQRKVLEVSYEAIENAGYSPASLENSDTGVYLGVMGRGYYDKVLVDQTDLNGHMFTSSLLGFLPNRISFHLNLKGPSIAIDTLCSSSLVAVHEACKSILNEECTMALAGGVYIHLSAQHYILLSKMNVLSKEGRCKTFDENANGIVSGEGAGILLLKSLEKALEDKDHIHAVIKGSVINSDGRSARFTTTNADAQVDMMHKALKKSNINPETISYIEAHGTGTKIGDPTELMALKQCYGFYTEKKGFCSIGSVKSSIGHLEPAAGIAGLIKTVISFKKGMIPPTLHVNKVNHFIDMIDSPFTINDRLSAWNKDTVKRAGVSAFGMGGTNAHIILEEAPEAEIIPSEDMADIFCFSAKTQKALILLLEKFIAFFDEKESGFHEYCYSSNISKTAYPHRAAFLAKSIDELSGKLKEAQIRLSKGELDLSGKGITDSFISNKYTGKKEIIFDVRGMIEKLTIEEAIKEFGGIKDDFAEIQKYVYKNNKTDKYSYDIEQYIVKYIFYKTLINFGVIPKAIIYDTKDVQLVALLLGLITLEESVSNIRNNKVTKLNENSGCIDGITVSLVISKDACSLKEKDSFLITPLKGDYKKTEYYFYTILADLYVNGVDIKWEKIYKGKVIYKTELPTYPFERQEYRIPFEEQRVKEVNVQMNETKPIKMLSEIYKSKDTGIYKITFGKEELSYYKEHSIFEEAVLPASAYIDAVYQAGSQYYGYPLKEINDFVFFRPCFIKEEMQLHIKIDKKGDITYFTLQSVFKTGNSEQWQEHAKGNFHLKTDKVSVDNVLESASSQLWEPLNVEDFYKYFKYTGIDYGKNFKLLSKLNKSGEKVWSEYTIDSINTNMISKFRLNPSALDAAFQTVVSLNYDNLDNKGEPFLPFYIKNMVIFNDTICKNKTNVIVNRSLAGRDNLKSDISIISKEGVELIRINGFHLKKNNAYPSVKNVDDHILSQCFEKSVWTKVIPDFMTEYTKDRLLLFDIDNEFSDNIRKILKEKGILYIRVLQEEGFQQKSENTYGIRPGEEQDIKKLLESVNNDLVTPDSILFLWSLQGADSLAVHDIDSGIKKGLLTLFVLLKQMYAYGKNKYKRLSVLTEEAFQISENDKVRPENSAIWGFMRVVKREFPNIKTKVIDINQYTGTMVEEAACVYKEIYNTNTESEVAYRNQERYKFTVEKSRELEPCTYENLKKDGTYMITGGTGGIGFSLMEQLAEDSKANIILIGRKEFAEIETEKIRKINDLIDKGRHIEYLSADITDVDSMNRAVALLKAKYGEINGIFHTAGEIRDALLIHKPLKDFMAVLSAKIKGTLILNELFQNEDLQFIMLFSSVSSIDGIIGQCDYAAANGFLDGMAEAVHKTIKYQSVNWSFWDVGMGAGSQKLALKNGYQVLSPKTAAKTALLIAGTTKKRVIIADRVKKQFQEKLSSPKVLKDNAASLSREINIEDYLKKLLAGILEISEENLDTESSFTDFGMDSLLAIQYIEEINKELNTKIDATELFSYQNISKLGEYLKSIRKESYIPDSEFDVEKIEKKVPVSLKNEETKLQILSLFKTKLSVVLELQEEFIDDNTSFMELGMDSILSTSFVEEIANEFKIDMDSTIVFEYPNLGQLTAYITEEYKEAVLDYLTPLNQGRDVKGVIAATKEETQEDTCKDKMDLSNESDIAIIGMACKFPGANNIDEFWDNLKGGISISEKFPMQRIDNSLEIYQSEDYQQRADTLYGSYLSNIDKFDSLFFEISPKEAEFMDPQQRIMLEVIWQAFEHASLSKESVSGTNTGVFVGACITEYMKYIKSYDGMAGTGNELSILSNRISYIYNLTGPSMTVDTACSSSLVALDLACQNILTGRCEMAVVGGINLMLTPAFSIIFEKAGMLSKEGKCKTFDERADGYLRGEGAGAIILKPLKQAIAHKDNILAVLKGTAVNQDGHSNGLTAPNTNAQKEVIQSAWKNSGIHPETITMVEAHGTGTSLGDPIEVKALTQAFGNYTNNRSYCALGSVKTNIGHLEPAAGISGIIKVILALNNKKLPPTCHFNKLNPLINLIGSPFYINDRLQTWESEDTKQRRAVVSSFGFGGTNAHVVLEEAPKINKGARSDFTYCAIPISGKQPDVVITRLMELKKYLIKHEDISLPDLSYTLFAGRDHYNYRICFTVQDILSLQENIQQVIDNKDMRLPMISKVSGKSKIVVILGDRWQFGDTFDLSGFTKSYPDIRESFLEIGRLTKEIMDIDANQLMSFEKFIRLHTSYNQKDLYVFLFNYLLGKLLIRFGLTNTEFFGTGLGAVAAKVLSDDILLEDCMKDISILSNKESETYKKLETLNRYEAYDWGGKRDRFSLDTTEDCVCLFLGENIFASNNYQAGIINQRTENVESVIIKITSFLYEKGCKFDWWDYFKNKNVYKIPLPGYPLSRKSYWAGRSKKEKEYTFIKKELIEKPLTEQKLSEEAFYILIGADEEGIIALTDEFQTAGMEYLMISLTNNLENDKDSIVRDLEKAIHTYEADGLRQENTHQIKLIYFNTYQSLNNEQKNDESERKTWYDDILRIFTITRYLDSQSINRNIEFIHIINQTKNDLNPTAFSASALCKILPYEFSYMNSKSVVLRSNYNITDLIKEIIYTDNEECVYLKDNKRFVEVYKKLEFIGNHAFTKKNESPVVIVTGGLSGIGFEISKCLLKRKNSRLVITGRADLDRQTEGGISAAKNNALSGNEKSKNFLELSKISPMIQYVKGDVSDYNTLQGVFEVAKKTYGRIDAVIHCAGVIDSQRISIRSKSEASIKQVLLPKVNGTVNLGILSEAYQVKKVVLFSSLAALSGFTGVGFSDYAAANAFMDAYAETYKGRNKILSINWPVWDKIGMSNRGLTTKQGNKICLDVAMEAFDELFENDYTGNLVVTGREADLLINSLMNGHIGKTSEKKIENKKLNNTTSKMPPDSAINKPQALLTELLKSILKLSDDEIDYDMNFSEFGLDSISLADMLGGIEKYYGRHFEPSIIIEYPTVNLLSQYLIQQQDGKDNRGASIDLEHNSSGYDEITHSHLKNADILKLLYDGNISIEQALAYMLAHEAVD